MGVKVSSEGFEQLKITLYMIGASISSMAMPFIMGVRDESTTFGVIKDVVCAGVSILFGVCIAYFGKKILEVDKKKK